MLPKSKKRVLLVAVLLAYCFPSLVFAGESGANPKALGLFKICNSSCSQRGGVFTFQVYGDAYNEDGSNYKCSCGDEVKKRGGLIVTMSKKD